MPKISELTATTSINSTDELPLVQSGNTRKITRANLFTGYYTAAQVDSLLSSKADSSTVTAHTSSTSNPHSTTAAQVGALATSTRGAANGVASLDSSGLIPDAEIPSTIARDSELTAHTSLTNNPHSVTAAQVGNTTAQWNASQLRGVNISTSTPTTGQVLKFDGTNWSPGTDVSGGGSGALDDLTDVVLTSPSNGQVLKFNGTNWVNGTDNTGGGGGGALDDLTDVVISSPSSGQVLKYDGTNWINDTDSTGGGSTPIASTSTTGTVKVNSNTADPVVYRVSEVDSLLSSKLNTADRGAANGVASLDSSGLVPDAQIPSSITRDSELTAHTSLTNNPHSVTAAQVGNSTAQWNADKLQGVSVSSTAPTTGQVLKYNGTVWIPSTDSTGGGGGNLDDLGDVTISSPSSGQVLKYNGSAWVNDADATGGGGSADYTQVLGGVGRWYVLLPGVSALTSSNSQQNQLRLTPIIVEKTIDVDGIGVNLTSAAAAGNTVRLGLFSSTNLVPDALLVDAGTTSTATSGAKSLTFTPITLSPGVYWGASAFTANVNSSVYSNTTQLGHLLGNTTINTSTFGTGYQVTWSGSSAFPSNVTGLSIDTNPSMVVWIRTA